MGCLLLVSRELVKRGFLQLQHFSASQLFPDDNAVFLPVWPLTTSSASGKVARVSGCRYLVLEYCAGGDVLDNLLSNGIMDELACEAQVRQALRTQNK